MPGKDRQALLRPDAPIRFLPNTHKAERPDWRLERERVFQELKEKPAKSHDVSKDG